MYITPSFCLSKIIKNVLIYARVFTLSSKNIKMFSCYQKYNYIFNFFIILDYYWVREKSITKLLLGTIKKNDVRLQIFVKYSEICVFTKILFAILTEKEFKPTKLGL